MKEAIMGFLQNGFLLKSDIVPLINQMDDSIVGDFISIIKKIETKERMLSKDFLARNFEKINFYVKTSFQNEDEQKIKAFQNFLVLIQPLLELEKKPEAEIKIPLNPLMAEKKQRNIKILKSWNLPTKKIEVKDFVDHFRGRYNLLKNFLQDKSELTGLTSISKISRLKQNVSIIGLVFDKRTTKNKNIILEVEDITGKIAVLIHKNKEELYEKAKEIVLDEVIAITGNGSSEIIFANNIFFPDIIKETPAKVEKDEAAAFISDLHVGSLKFLEEPFLRFIKWLNGELGDEQQKEISKKVKYLFINGDIVDGIGIYPGQEDELLIKDIREQYKKTAELLSKIRKDITIFICPGNHDAVRIAEPQPILDKRLAEPLYALDNAILLSNPCVITVGASSTSKGFVVLMYHGYSFDYYAGEVESLRLGGAYKRPDKIIHFLLKKRHLAPTHASCPYFPNESDPLVITEVPDVFVSAHIHRSAISSYNKITTIACSCWQAKTAFQEKFGHEPDPCKVPILNLKSNKINIIDFNE